MSEKEKIYFDRATIYIDGKKIAAKALEITISKAGGNDERNRRTKFYPIGAK